MCVQIQKGVVAAASAVAAAAAVDMAAFVVVAVVLAPFFGSCAGLLISGHRSA